MVYDKNIFRSVFYFRAKYSYRRFSVVEEGTIAIYWETEEIEMTGMLFLITYFFIILIPGCCIAYSIVMKKILKSNDVGTKVRLIDFSTDEGGSKFYCKHDVDPGKIIANTGLKHSSEQEDEENDWE